MDDVLQAPAPQVVPNLASESAGPAVFADLFRASPRKQDLCILAVLAWVAASDGRIAPIERELLVTVAEAGGGTDALPAILEMAQQGRPRDLEIACRFLRNQTTRGVKRLLARLAVTMAVQDGHLTIGENFILQFLADLLGIGPRAFARLFEQIAHRSFPVPGDPSDPAWWHLRETGGHLGAGPDAWDRPSSARRPARAAPTLGSLTRATQASDAGDEAEPMTFAEAYQVLGLDGQASHEAVHAAYRRLAKARHPDRFAKLGPAAVATATFAFERLKEAYALLS
jgi:DnaJ-domain-containing protein 1